MCKGREEAHMTVILILVWGVSSSILNLILILVCDVLSSSLNLCSSEVENQNPFNCVFLLVGRGRSLTLYL